MINLLRKYDGDYSLLLICFSGRRSGEFEWVNITEGLKAKKLFLRDMKDHWYLFGLDGNTLGPDNLVSFLKEEIKLSKTSKVITIGASMGAYAAILYGCLLNVNDILAISPMSNLETRKDAMDDVLPRSLPGYDTGLLMDIVPIVQNNMTTMDIHCGDYQEDILYAKSLCPHFTIHPECKDHFCATFLTKKGVLRKMLEKKINSTRSCPVKTTKWLLTN